MPIESVRHFYTSSHFPTRSNHYHRNNQNHNGGGGPAAVAAVVVMVVMEEAAFESAGVVSLDASCVVALA